MARRIKLQPTKHPVCYQHGTHRVLMVTNGTKEESGKRYWACPWPGCKSRACTDLEPLMVEIDEADIPDDVTERQYGKNVP